jgi:hypothetical protein
VLELEQQLPTHIYLEEIKTHFPNDPRLEAYDVLHDAVSKIDPFILLTITFASRVSDEITCEGICRRFTHQLRTAVIGKRASSTIPCFVVLEKGTGSSFHAHILIGRVKGRTRSLSDTTLKSYLQKKPLTAILKILNRLTYPTSKGKAGKIGICHIQTVYSKDGAIDYLLKALKPNQLKVAWLASNVDFSNSDSSVRPQRPKHPN